MSARVEEEMSPFSKETLSVRMLSNMTGININNLQQGLFSQNDWPRISSVADNLSKASIYVNDSGTLSSSEIASTARILKAREKLGLIIVDYLQLMRSDFSGERHLEIEETTKSLKMLAKELHVPVIALSQINRSADHRQDKRPMLSDLNWSRSIEPYADRVIFIFRDEYYDRREDNPNRGIAEIILAKQRNGPLGTVKLAFTRSCGRFQNLP